MKKGNAKEKLERLAEEYGTSSEELVLKYGTDEVVPGICMNDGCDFTAEYEPDQLEGWCEECDTGSVRSALVLADLI